MPDLTAMFNDPHLQQFLNNPEAIETMVRANPFFQQYVDNPDALADVFAGGDPAAITALFQNVDFRTFLNDPATRQLFEHFATEPQALTGILRATPMFANAPGAQAILDNPELLQEQLRGALEMLGQGAPIFVRPPFGFGGFAAQPGTIDTALLARLLGAQAGQAQMRLIADNPDVRRGLAEVLQGIAICRRNGLALLSDVPNIDTVIAASVANLTAPAPAAAQRGPEQRFAAELQRLNAAGFDNNQRNIEALVATNGNVELAIVWLSEQ
jgi:ubiquilin